MGRMDVEPFPQFGRQAEPSWRLWAEMGPTCPYSLEENGWNWKETHPHPSATQCMGLFWGSPSVLRQTVGDRLVLFPLNPDITEASGQGQETGHGHGG